MPATSPPIDIHDVNRRYHDVAADDYDSKWNIDFGPNGQRQVLAKLGKALGPAPLRFERSLEIGAGTGYFTLNMLQAGLLGSAVCSDISPGMLEALTANAARLSLKVETVAARADALPFADNSFDLVFGHAVLHHLPSLDRSFDELQRVLRPGGRLLFAGEPSRAGNRLAAIPKRAGLAAAPLWRRLVNARARSEGASQGRDVQDDGDGRDGDDALESLVDVHAFMPDELAALATRAGLEAVGVRGEELFASWFGWFNRTLEATANPADVPWLWRQYAYRGYLVLKQIDGRLLERLLPPAVFYNLIVVAQKPSASARFHRRA